MASRYRFIQDYQVGQKGSTASGFGTRTLTDYEFSGFACITADYHRNHLDREYMAESVYGTRVAHGLLGSSMALGMLSLNTPHTVGRDVPGAYLYSFDTNYRRGIKLHDTISINWEIVDRLERTDYPGYGMVKTSYVIVDQNDDPLYDGVTSFLVRQKSSPDAELKLNAITPEEVPGFTPDPDRYYYAEDYPVGKGGETSGRTITEADLVNYAALVGDYNPLYVDAEYARQTVFGERIANPVFIFDCAFGLWARERNQMKEPKSEVAGHLNDSSIFHAPVRIGDTIRCRYRTTESRISRKRPDAGIVTFELQVINQRDELVQRGHVVLMFPSREALKK